MNRMHGKRKSGTPMQVKARQLQPQPTTGQTEQNLWQDLDTIYSWTGV